MTLAILYLKNDRIWYSWTKWYRKKLLSLKMITGKLQPDSGTIEVGDTV